ncbi:jg22819 [Pararge aegeria aegeria]|uniref:Jg22819 protein n=1 Tax=Pararge aegeria aegeria TaxID=348720 RepID=A0A8S4RWC6_9NEOP|nr:jg22819 [Pararge aegeria aegeria]
MIVMEPGKVLRERVGWSPVRDSSRAVHSSSDVCERMTVSWRARLCQLPHIQIECRRRTEDSSIIGCVRRVQGPRTMCKHQCGWQYVSAS